MDKILENKWQQLLNYLSKFPSVLVAYSGGVDSSLLAYAAFKALNHKMLAVTVNSGLETKEQLQQAKDVAEKIGFPHKVISLPYNNNEEIINNSPLRCYYCKKSILMSLLNVAKEIKAAAVIEGNNIDDLQTYRPGRQAIEETNTLSPFVELHFTKPQIRELAEIFNLPMANFPSSPCLATRIPYGTKISNDILKQVEAAESFLRNLGHSHFRVRHHGDTARIETSPEDFNRIIQQKEEIVKAFKSMGYHYITLDLEGYRSGSMDSVLPV